MKTFSIIFENEEILLVNKEGGVSVQGGAGIAHPLDAELSIQLGYKIFLVHRLDKETSGILVVAKNARIRRQPWEDPEYPGERRR